MSGIAWAKVEATTSHATLSLQVRKGGYTVNGC